MISGKSFSDLCRWVVDPRYPARDVFYYGRANSGDWVFVNGDFLHSLTLSLPVVSIKKFVFIVHNTDRSFGEPELRLLAPHALHMYAINTSVYHPKLTTIPLGFVDRQLPFLHTFAPTNEPKTIDIYMNFTSVTNVKKRKECAEVFQRDTRVVLKQGLSVDEYYADLCRSNYVLCPEGTGMDTHRVYEALLCGATPVVLRNSLSSLYGKLPVCILDNWTDPFYKPSHSDFPTNPQFYLTT